MPGERFTSWLGEDERAKLREVARACDTSENHILRLALRSTLFHKPVPAWLTDATQATDNHEEVHA